MTDQTYDRQHAALVGLREKVERLRIPLTPAPHPGFAWLMDARHNDALDRVLRLIDEAARPMGEG